MKDGFGEVNLSDVSEVRVLKPAAVYPDLRGRVVLITGGASGIGEALVTAFAEQGAAVIFFDVQDELAGLLVDRVRAEGGEAPAYSPVYLPVYYRCDLTDVEAIQETIGRVLEVYSTIDVLINNAGDDTRHNVDAVTPEFWDRCMAVNLRHQFFVAQAVIPAMREAGRGSIINMSSIAWTIPSTGLPVYVTAKAAIVGMTRTLAHEVGMDNIRVNCIMPGAILTKRQKELWLTPEYEAEILRNQALKRLIQPEEVASLALFLASEVSSAITNQAFVIDAGWT